MGKDEETKELVGARTKNLKYGFSILFRNSQLV
jgi:hypothetical protein